MRHSCFLNSSSLQTTRLRLRALDPEVDAPFILQVLNEPAFVRNVGDRGIRTEADAARYIRDRIVASYAQFGFGMWLTELKETNEAVGICGLIKREALPDVDIGFSLLERFWSHGYAFEAASAVMDFAWNVAKLHRVVAIVSPQNSASCRLLEKLGMHLEGTCRLIPESPELSLFAATNPQLAANR